MNLIYTLEKPHHSFISSLQFNPVHDNLLASSSNDRYIKLWKIDEEFNKNEINESRFKVEQIYDYKIHLYGINQIKWNQDGNMLASAGNDCSVNVIDVNNQKMIRNFRIDSCVTCLDFNYASNLILFGTFDNQIILYDMRSKNLISQILAHSEPITSVSFSKDSTLIMSSSYDGFCRIWDTFKGNCLKTIVLEKSPPINKVSFLPNKNYLLISTLNSQIQVLDLLKEEEILKYTGHLNTNYLIDQCIIKNEDENFSLLSGSEDGNIYMWNVEDDAEDVNKLSHSNSNKNLLSYDLNNNINTNDGSKIIINSIGSNNHGVIAAAGFPDINNNINFLKLI